MVIVVENGHGDTSSKPGEGNSEFKLVKLHLKIDLVSYPAREEGLVNKHNHQETIVWRFGKAS